MSINLLKQKKMEQKEFLKNRELYLTTKSVKASNTLYNGLSDFGMNLIYNSGVSMEDREDVLALAIIAAFENLAYYREEFMYTTWFGRILKNKLIDFQRKQKSIKSKNIKSIDSFYMNDNMESEPITVADKYECPLERMNNEYLLALLSDKIAKVKDAKKKEIIMMYFNDGKCNSEIISELKMKKEIVNVTIFRFKQSMKEYFGNWGNYTRLML